MVDQTLRQGAFVVAYAPPKNPAAGAHDGIFGGDDTAAAIVTRVNEDGTLNLRMFAPYGGEDHFATGVMAKDDLAKLDDGDPARMAISWGWPS